MAVGGYITRGIGGGGTIEQYLLRGIGVPRAAVLSISGGYITRGIGGGGTIEQYLLRGLEVYHPTVLSVFGMPNHPGVMRFEITIAEITETTDLDNIMVWDRDAWDRGKVWGS
jgi:hypothetical protein